MENYYRILGLDATATEDQIRQSLRENKRVWYTRLNAPKLETRQEAERIIKLVPEIEKTLLDQQSRKSYDSQLRTAPRQEAAPARDTASAADLIKLGWDQLAEGNIPGALAAATKAAKTHQDNPDAWALLGYAKALWGDEEDAVKYYKYAIKLRPDDAELYFELGTVLEELKQWEDAIKQYQRAAKIDPSKPAYRAGIGSVYIKNDMFDDGIKILSQSLSEDTGNEGYKFLLAIAYSESGFRNWTEVGEGGKVPAGFYATTNAQVVEAEEMIRRAEEIGATDSDINQRLSEIRENISAMRKRRFHGNALAAGAAILLGAFMLFSGDKSVVPGGLVYVPMGLVYIASCLTPQYKLNSRIVEGRTETSGGYVAEMGAEGGIGGCFGMLMGLVFILPFMPFMIVWNFIKNYGMK